MMNEIDDSLRAASGGRAKTTTERKATDTVRLETPYGEWIDIHIDHVGERRVRIVLNTPLGTAISYHKA